MRLPSKILWAIACVLCSQTVLMAADDSTQPADTSDGITHIIIHPGQDQRNDLSPDTGSSKYVFDAKAIDALPGGDTTPLNDVLLQAPGVAQDSYGQLHVRGDHADLQYRINGIILPEGITGFGQTLDTHFADKIDLLTGALPAQYGYRTAGIVDITTKSGNITDGGQTSVTVGSDNTLEGNQEFYGSKHYDTGSTANYYFSGNYLQNSRGIEPPTASNNTLHDDSSQDKEFGYLSYTITPQAKLSVIVGNATNRFEIPNNPGQPQTFTLAGTANYPSSNLNEQQFEHNTYAIAALQGALAQDVDYQIALFTRYSNVLFKPDPIGDLIYNGIASQDYLGSFTNGIQNDYSYHLNSEHTIRAGWTLSYELAQSDNNSSVFSGFFDPTAQQTVQTGTTPFTVIDDSNQGATLFGVYLQDEWKFTDKLTINYGARFDEYSAYVNDNQVSPRVGLVYEATSQTTFHTGYARYFTPPDTQFISPISIQQFANTTGALPSTTSSPVVPEKDNYFDAGVIQKVGTSGLTLGMDAYYKQAHDLLDEGQFGQALIFAPFNYDKGWVKGVEFTGDYKHDAFTGYANLALSQALGKDVVSGQYNFTQAELDYIASNAVHLDHDQLVTGSVGAAYMFHAVNYTTDVLFGSGLRDGFANTEHLPFYTQVNLGADHDFGIFDAKFSVINLFDRVYEIRDGSGIGVFAPQYGPRRGVFLTLSKAF